MQMTRCTKCMEELPEGVLACPHCGYEQDSAVQPHSALKRGTILHGRYYTGNVIGQGGFGITYVGWDLVLEMKVAVKEYFPSGSASRTNSYSNEIQWDFAGGGRELWAEGLDRFLREARKMAKLDSVPAIVRVRDAFRENRTAYIVMDFVEGVTLKQYLLSHGPLNYEACMSLLSPILDSLAVIHERGFIHRDISPDNIMLQPDGTARLLDMGAAVDMKVSGGRASMAVVKRNFSAPEQYMESEILGSWTDVYAMGATMYYCMTGKVVPEALERELKNIPLNYDPNRNIPPHVITALNDALVLRAENRIRDMREFKRRLSAPVKPAPEEERADEANIFRPGPDLGSRTAKEKTAKEHGKMKRAAKVALITAGSLSAMFVLTILFYAFRDSGGSGALGAEGTAAMAESTAETAVQVTAQTTAAEEVAAAPPATAAPPTAAGEAAAAQTAAAPPTAAPPVSETADAAKYVEVAPSDLVYGKMKDEEGILLREYTGKGEPYIKLPDEIEGEPVVRLGVFFFMGNETLEGIILPEGVEYIGWNTFSDCTNLKQIVLPKNLEVIDSSAFSGCTSLRQLELPEGLKTIGEYAFEGAGLEKITIPSTVQYLSLGSGIFHIPQIEFAGENPTFTVVDGLIYKNGHELTAVPDMIEGSFVIPPEISAIGRYAFYSTSLTEVTIPGYVRVVGPSAFEKGRMLQKVTIEEGVEELGYHSFARCGSLSEIIIPRSVKSIDFNAFHECQSLKTVTISRDCQIADDAFDQGVEIKYYD